MSESKKLDINVSLWQYYDSTLLIKIIDFYLKKGTYDKSKLLAQKLKVLGNTNLDALARTTFKELHGNDKYPSSYDEHLIKMNEKKKELETILEKPLAFLRSEAMVNMLKEEKLFNMTYIKQNFDFDEKSLELIYQYAKLLYDSGLIAGIFTMNNHKMKMH